VEHNSELNAIHVAVLNVKAKLLSLSKSQAREKSSNLKSWWMTSWRKLKHAIYIQEMHVKVNRLALEETRERTSNTSAAPKTPKQLLAMGLDNKKELATHNALLKKQQKENNDAKAALKKDLNKGRHS
jgi:hypothetical protein